MTTKNNKKVITGVRGAIYELIAKNKYTKNEILKLICTEWAHVKAATVLTYLTDAKNPKYTASEFLAVENAKNKIFSFSDIPSKS